LIPQDQNNRSSSESSKRSLVLFPDDTRSGLVRPFRAVSSQSAHGKNGARPAAEKPAVVPNYRTVIGASYDDVPRSKTVDDDFEDLEDQKSDSKRTNFSKQVGT
jgi:hypothetical protein